MTFSDYKSWKYLHIIDVYLHVQLTLLRVRNRLVDLFDNNLWEQNILGENFNTWTKKKKKQWQLKYVKRRQERYRHKHQQTFNHFKLTLMSRSSI